MKHSYPKNRKSRAPKPFCKYGHDISIVGRDEKGPCAECVRVYRDERYQATSLEDKKKQMLRTKQAKWRNEGIINKDGTPFTSVDYDRNYQIQQGRCLGCKNHQTDLGRALCVDHDHETKLFRGLLCRSCNLALGHIKDDPETALRLITYLNQFKGQ